MNTDTLVDQVVDSMATNLREEHILREMLRSLVRLAKAEQSLEERKSRRMQQDLFQTAIEPAQAPDRQAANEVPEANRSAQEGPTGIAAGQCASQPPIDPGLTPLPPWPDSDSRLVRIASMSAPQPEARPASRSVLRKRMG